MELQVTNSPFNQEQVELLNRLIPTLTDGQRTWLSGYIAAIQASATITAPANLVQAAPATGIAPVSAPPVSREVTVLLVHKPGIPVAYRKSWPRNLKSKVFR